MAQRRLAFLLIVAAIIVLLPTVGYAQGISTGSGLIPCGVSGSADEATECQACHLVQLSQNIIMFLIGLSIPIAVAMFAWAGVLYFTSAANQENINKAKSIFGSALFGFVLAIGAWLIVNTLLYTILDKNQFPNSSWFRIECSDRRPVSGTIGQLLENVLGVAPTPTPQQPNFSGYTATPSCDPGFILRDGDCKNLTTGEIRAPTLILPSPVTGGSLSQERLTQQLAGTYQYSAELRQICAREGLTNCNLAQAVMAIESGGRAGVISSAECVGLMQICPGTARDMVPSLLGGRSDAEIQQILVNNPSLNMTLGVRYLAGLTHSFGDTTVNTIAGYNGGPGANRRSVTCPGETYWSCAQNEGYAETRNYVPNVLNAMALISR